MERTEQLIGSLRVDIISDEDSFKQFSSLLDSCFPVSSGAHFFDDFPVWNPKLEVRKVLRIGVFQDKKLVSSTAVRLAQMKISKQGIITVAVIGAVATHPDWRGTGLASNTVSLVTQWAKERGACVALVWGSELKLYQRLGFELCGQQIRVPLTEINLSSSESLKIHRGWTPQLFKLLQNRKGGFILNGGDQFLFEAHKNVEWFYTGTSDQPKAYAALGRGIDLKGLVHEWGGETTDLLGILQFIQGMNGHAALLGSPGHVKDLGVSFQSAQPEFLCMAKILDPITLLSSYHPEVPVEANNRNDRWDVSMGLHSWVSITDHELTRAVFGPPPSNKAGDLGFLPLSFWVWGLDAA